MTAYHIRKPNAHLVGQIQLDGSKSLSNRAILINALCQSPAQLYNCSSSDDTVVLQKAINSPSPTIDIGAAGTSMRFLTAYLASKIGAQHTLTGSERMQQRPIGLLVEALQMLGANIQYANTTGFPPLNIIGQQLKGGKISIDSSMSSQYISALLMIGPLLTSGLELQLTGNRVSESYISMTLAVMQHFGVSVEQVDNCLIVPHQTYTAPQNYWIESDWSAASYYYSMAAMTIAKGEQCDLSLHTLYAKSTQGDSAIQAMGKEFGVQTELGERHIRLQTLASVCGSDSYWNQNFVTCPDIAQTMAVLCGAVGKRAQLEGLQTLRIKETDRTAALSIELEKIGIRFFAVRDHCWQIVPPLALPTDTTPIFDTYDDHRMAMSLAPLAICLPQGVVIRHPHVVSKSYPRFWKDLEQLGFEVNAIE